MIVENIDYSDKLNLVVITIDGEKFLISYDLYYDLNLSSESQIDFDSYKVILKDDQYNKAKNLALRKISFSPKSSSEINKILKTQHFDQDIIEKTINFLKDFDLIDDEAFVRSFITDKHNISKWPKNKIRYALRSKNIDDYIIEEYLSEISDEDEYQNAYDFAINKAKGDDSFQMRQKVFRFLASKGFDFDIINNVLGDIFQWLMVMFIF